MGISSFAVALAMTMVISSHSIYGREFYDDLYIEVENLLKQLNRYVLKSIKSEDGDIIDCVSLASQPAFDHPLLKNHTIRPSFIPKRDSTYIKKKAKAITQVWHKNGEYCLENTIPIRRINKVDILRAKSIESFGKKTPTPSIVEVTSSRHYEYALAYTSGKLLGTQASINIWKPYVADNEFSVAQARLVTEVGLNLNAIEAGWQVNPSIYGGDKNTRLFVRWTGDRYKNIGCFDLLCPGFVQVSRKYSIGGTIATISEYKGIQYDLNLLIWKDHDTGHWWLQLNDKDLIGYWPGSLFDSLGDGAMDIQWGGKVYVHDNTESHSLTDMGSGIFAVRGYGKASYIRNLQTVSETKSLLQPVGISRYVTDDSCYGYLKGQTGTTLGKHFYYGGPGKNSQYTCVGAD